ncbi:RNA-directed DNA polymerase, eukaryota, reverse transcriptase zinc-binding domain protein [Tanacetum coccineum]
MVKETDSSPVIVLEEDCLNSKDLSNSLIVRVKSCWGHYQTYEGVGSWFSVLRQASHDFTPEGRIAWVDVEGIPFKFWSGKTFKKIATKWGELLDVDDHDEMSFHSKRIAFTRKYVPNICENLKIVFKGKVHWIELKKLPAGYPSSPKMKRMMIILNRNSSAVNSRILNSAQISSGFTPSVEKNGSKSKDDQVQNISDNQLNGDNEFVHQVEREYNRNSDGAKKNSTGSRKFKMSEIPRTGGSILSVMEEIIKVGLEEVPLGGSAYTWCHKSASKMSKLDRFLILEDAPGDDSMLMRNLCAKLEFLSLVNLLSSESRSGVEEFQLDNLSRLVSTITLSSAVDRYVRSLENSGEFSVKSIRQVIDANCFSVIHSATKWVKSVPLKLARKISSWWNVDYVDVSSYEEWYTWLSIFEASWQISKAGVRGIFYCFYGGRFGCSYQDLFEKDTPYRRGFFDNIVSNSYYWCRV